MINANNQPFSLSTKNEDFTLVHYRELIRLANKNYQFVTYDVLPVSRAFILWRHDCDYSLNRSYQLAVIEQEEGVESTYFINPHCEFYNLFEKSQSDNIAKILRMGHKLGLHFDAAYYDISNEDQLSELVKQEATILQMAFGTRPEVFSFHNPTEYILTCEKEQYGGLLNTYSKWFKENVPYCSDSNGYWRFTRLRDVLQQASDPCLQVLTHPGWWQNIPLAPRQRIFRSVYGRAEATLCGYDTMLESFSRINHIGYSSALVFLKGILPEAYLLCDYLWNKSKYDTLFIELWRLHEGQINQLCRIFIKKEWHIQESVVDVFFQNNCDTLNGYIIFNLVFRETLMEAIKVSDVEYNDHLGIMNSIFYSQHITSHNLERCCIFICTIIKLLAHWGDAHLLLKDHGLKNIGYVNTLTDENLDLSTTNRQNYTFKGIDDVSKKKWDTFISKILDMQN